MDELEIKPEDNPEPEPETAQEAEQETAEEAEQEDAPNTAPQTISIEEWMASSAAAVEEPPQTEALEDAQLMAVLEGCVYVAEEPLTAAQLAAALHQDPERITALMKQLMAEFERPEHGICIKEVAGGYKMATKAEHHEAVRSFVKSLKAPLKLSLPALETLAVIAYKQPVTTPEIMEIRGVQGGSVLKTLLDRKLIAEAGRKNVIGKPILFKTTKEFLIQFGLKDLAELPSLKEFEEIRRMSIADNEPPAETPVPVEEPTSSAPPVEEPPATPGRPDPVVELQRRGRGAPAASGRSSRGRRAHGRNPRRRRASHGRDGAGAIGKAGALMPEERLQKIISQAGVTSRRQAEKYILEGRVMVNGTVITELGSKADLQRDHIKVDGRLLHAPKHQIYIALNKPNNTVTTTNDPEHRATVMDLLRGVKERVYPVGRLDYHSEGLLLLTNDGELANAITSKSSHLAKTYLVKSNGPLTTEQEEKFRTGVPLSGKRTMPAGLKLIRDAPNPWYEVRLHEGRNNQIRLMFKNFGRLVEKLRRVRIGPLELGPLKPGEFRHLSTEELQKLKRAALTPAKAPRVRESV